MPTSITVAPGLIQSALTISARPTAATTMSAWRTIPGRSLLREGKYEQAMRYFKLANDEVNYSKAFQEQRKIWVEENIGWIFAVFAAALALPLALGRLKRVREELREL